MINYLPGDLVLVNFPLTSSGPGKPRPAMVLFVTGDADVGLARVTTQFATTPFDISITEWQNAGLLAPSIVRLHKTATLAKSLIMRKLGQLDSIDRSTVAIGVRKLFAT